MLYIIAIQVIFFIALISYVKSSLRSLSRDVYKLDLDNRLNNSRIKYIDHALVRVIDKNASLANILGYTYTESKFSGYVKKDKSNKK